VGNTLGTCQHTLHLLQHILARVCSTAALHHLSAVAECHWQARNALRWARYLLLMNLLLHVSVVWFRLASS
jgi:hypothetical protein